MKIILIASFLFICVSCGDSKSDNLEIIKNIASRQIISIDLVKIDRTKFVVQTLKIDGKEMNIRVYNGANDYGKNFIMINENNILVEISNDENEALMSK